MAMIKSCSIHPKLEPDGEKKNTVLNSSYLTNYSVFAESENAARCNSVATNQNIQYLMFI